jgi:hypothetical protein
VLSARANPFQKTEIALEGDHFASGPHFMPKLLPILHNIIKFATDYPKALDEFIACGIASKR